MEINKKKKQIQNQKKTKKKPATSRYVEQNNQRCVCCH